MPPAKLAVALLALSACTHPGKIVVVHEDPALTERAAAESQPPARLAFQPSAFSRSITRSAWSP